MFHGSNPGNRTPGRRLDVKERECAIEVIGVEWCRDEAMKSRRVTGSADPLSAGIRSIDVVCHVCGTRFRALRVAAPGQKGFHALIYNVTIACDCGAVSALGIEELKG